MRQQLLVVLACSQCQRETKVALQNLPIIRSQSHKTRWTYSDGKFRCPSCSDTQFSPAEIIADQLRLQFSFRNVVLLTWHGNRFVFRTNENGQTRNTTVDCNQGLPLVYRSGRFLGQLVIPTQSQNLIPTNVIPHDTHCTG